MMLALARGSMAHRRAVIVAWVVVAVLITVVARVVGPNYVTEYSLPGTQTQLASDLLKRDFHAQSGDADAIVFHVGRGSIDAAAVRAAITPLLARVSRLPHVTNVVGPYGAGGVVQVSSNRMTAFATVNYDKPANELATDTGKPLLALVNAVHVPGLEVAAGGQVIENAEGSQKGSASGRRPRSEWSPRSSFCSSRSARSPRPGCRWSQPAWG